MLFLIEKSNLSGRWTGRKWWVEADTAEQAVAIARGNWPSKNTTDQFHARPLTEAEQDEYCRQQSERDIEIAGRSGARHDKRADRKAAYLEKCGQNKLNALNKNVEVLGHVTPTIERIAERIHDDTARKIDEAYRQ